MNVQLSECHSLPAKLLLPYLHSLKHAYKIRKDRVHVRECQGKCLMVWKMLGVQIYGILESGLFPSNLLKRVHSFYF